MMGRARTLKLPLLALLLLLPGCAGGTMTAYRLQRDAISLQSLAGDGALLADQASKGRAPSPFVAAHASAVGADAGDLASVIRSTHPQPGLAVSTHRLAVLAQRASDLLERLEHAANDERGAARIHDQLAGIAAAAGRVAEP